MGLLSKYIKLIFKRFNGETVEEYVENVPTVPGALSELNVKLGGNESDIKATDTKVHALGRIYKTLGGTDDTSRIYTTAQMIRKITEVAEQGGEKPSLIKINLTTDKETIKPTVYGFDENMQPKNENLAKGAVRTFYFPIMGGSGKRAIATFWQSQAQSSNYASYVAEADKSGYDPEFVMLGSNQKFAALFLTVNQPPNPEVTLTVDWELTLD